MRHVTKPKPFNGYTFMHPDGSLGHHVCSNPAAARSDAAFTNHVGRQLCNSITLPDDWYLAKKQGYRIVRVRVKPL